MNSKTVKILETVKNFIKAHKIPVILVCLFVVASTAITCATCG